MTEVVSYVTIGRLTRPHGIRGAICAQYYAQSFKYLENGQAFLKTEKSLPKPLHVASYKEQGNTLVLKIKGVDSRTEAEFLRNFDIVIKDTLLEYEDQFLDCENENILDLYEDEFSSAMTSAKGFDSSSSLASELSSHTTEKKLEKAPFLHHLVGAKIYLCYAYCIAHAVSAKQDDKNQKQEPYLGVIEEIIFPADQEIWCIKTDEGEEILFPAVSDFVDRYDLSDLTHVKVYLNPPSGLLEIYMDSNTN